MARTRFVEDRTVFCDCAQARVPCSDCNACDFDDLDDSLAYEDPPLYPAGKLASMTIAELESEIDRQCNIHDAAVDRCEEINSPTIETAQFRIDACKAEIDRRSAPAHPDGGTG